MSDSRKYYDALRALDNNDINEVLDNLYETGILNDENCYRLYNSKDNPETTKLIHEALSEILAENLLGFNVDEEDENTPYQQKSGREISEEAQYIVNQIFFMEKEREKERIRKEKQREIITTKLHQDHIQKMLNDVNKEIKKYYEHLTTNIWGMKMPGPQDKIKQVEELQGIINDKERAPETKIIDLRAKISEYKTETDQEKGLATPRNPRWDKFLDALLSILLINVVRNALYGPFFRYTEGKKMIENSYQIIEDYKPLSSGLAKK